MTRKEEIYKFTAMHEDIVCKTCKFRLTGRFRNDYQDSTCSKYPYNKPGSVYFKGLKCPEYVAMDE